MPNVQGATNVVLETEIKIQTFAEFLTRTLVSQLKKNNLNAKLRLDEFTFVFRQHDQGMYSHAVTRGSQERSNAEYNTILLYMSHKP